EFGDVGVDGDILRSCGIESCPEENIVELANGCLCCTVADDFLPTMETLLGRANPPEHILIETSGLALPKPLVKAFTWPEVKARATVDGVIAVVDAPAVAAGRFVDDPEAMAKPDHENPLDEVFSDQLACADLVLANKADLMAPEAFGQLSRDLALKLRPGVKLMPARHGQVAPEILLGLAAAAEDDLDTRPALHDSMDDHDHEDFESFALDLGPIAQPEALEAKLAHLVARHDILRIKGFLDVPGKPMRLALQGVGPRFTRYFDRPWAKDQLRASRLVFIGLKGIDKTAIAEGLLD
ncbi:MAG: cobalamin biosynthesis protein CobW, partial [Rhodospirillales bacterium]|nr:cobalamin biosynthesis protein CobW [Rhodospirillales bacterium]